MMQFRHFVTGKEMNQIVCLSDREENVGGLHASMKHDTAVPCMYICQICAVCIDHLSPDVVLESVREKHRGRCRAKQQQQQRRRQLQRGRQRAGGQ